MQTLGNYITGRWVEGKGEGQILADAVTGIPLYKAGTEGLDFQEILQYARDVGNNTLRRMSFHERGRMLKALALYLQTRLENFTRSAIKPAPHARIHGSIWKEVSGIFFPMLHCAENFLTSRSAQMVIRLI